MEPSWRKTVLAAENFTGGLHREVFMARERFVPQGGLRGGQAVLRDRVTRRPLLIRRPLGRGMVWLTNVTEYPDSREYQLLANRIVRTIFERARKIVTLCRGPFISFFRYPQDADGGSFHRLFALNNDWYSTANRHTAVFAFEGVTFPLVVPRGTVRQAFLLPGRVIVPNSPWIRLDGCHQTAPGQLQIDLQGSGSIALTMYSSAPVRNAALDTRPLAVRSEKNRQVIMVRLTGKHNLSIEASS